MVSYVIYPMFISLSHETRRKTMDSRTETAAQLHLRALVDADREAFLEAVAAWPASESMTFAPGFDTSPSFPEYVTLLNAQAQGEKLPEGWVPSVTVFAFVGSEIVGRVQLRMHLNDFLRRVGGQIGYVVLPAFRRRGYAKAMLGQALRLARTLGLRRVLLTCDDDNPASIHTIEGAGGTLEDTVVVGDDMPKKRRYWIELG